MKQYKNHSTDNTKHSRHKYTYYQIPTHYKTNTYTHPHSTVQVNRTTAQDTPK